VVADADADDEVVLDTKTKYVKEEYPVTPLYVKYAQPSLDEFDVIWVLLANQPTLEYVAPGPERIFNPFVAFTLYTAISSKPPISYFIDY